jgi:hypothetical protein
MITEEFGLFGHIFYIYGLFGLKKNLIKSKSMKCIITIPTVIATTFYIIQSIIYCFNWKTHFSFDISWIGKTYINIYAFALIATKSNHLMKLMFNVQQKLAHFKLIQNCKRCALLATVWVLIILFNLSIFILWCQHIGPERYLLRFYDPNLIQLSPFILIVYVTFDLTFYPFFIDGFYALVILIYSYVNYCIGLLYDKQMFQIKNYDFNHKHNYELLQMFRQIRINHYNLQTFKKQINDIFHLLPFVWFAQLFGETCYRLLHLSNATFAFTQTETLFYWSEYISIAIVLTLMIQIVGELDIKDDSLMFETQVLFTSLDANQLSVQLYAENLLLMEQMTSHYKMTASQFFVLRRRLVLTFLASVIPFCVMAFQITQSDKTFHQIHRFSTNCSN